MELRPHWWFFAGPGAAFTGLVVVLVVVLRARGDVRAVSLLAWGAAAVAWAVWMLARLARWATTLFVVTNDRLIVRTGVLSRHGREIPLERINDISYHQSLWERVIGAGALLVESAGEMGQETFSYVPHPDAVHQEIYRQVEANRRRTASAVAAGTGGSIPDQIAQLAELRDRGILSPEEFEAKKRDLLDRL